MKIEKNKAESKVSIAEEKLRQEAAEKEKLKEETQYLNKQVENFRKLAKENVDSLFTNVKTLTANDNYNLKPQLNKGLDDN